MKFRDVRKYEFPEKSDFPVVCFLPCGRYDEAFVATGVDGAGAQLETWHWVNKESDRYSYTGEQQCLDFPIWIPVSELVEAEG